MSNFIDFSKAKANNYLFFIDKLPGIELYVNIAPLPSLSSTGVIVQAPYSGPFSWPSAGLEFEELTITAVADEYFNYYFSLLNWMHNNDAKTDLDNVMYGRATTVIYGNDKRTKIAQIEYYDIWPTLVSSLDFTTSTADTATFYFNLKYHYRKYEYFNTNGKLLIERLNTPDVDEIRKYK